MTDKGLLDGKYQLLSQLGEGGMGVVWRAHHVLLNRPVAIKFIRREALGDETAERFMNEARNTAAVRHPNVIDVSDVGVTPAGEPYLVMELLNGESLAQRLTRGPLSVPECSLVASHVLLGLSAVHEAGLVHRDLKPDNIFITRPGGSPLVKLIDFGIARRAERAQERAITQIGTLVGTPDYMSFEQLLGTAVLDARSDLFAVGVILYEALTGALPHTGASIAALTVARMNQEPAPLRGFRPDVPESLSAVIHRALRREREDRYPSARAMLEALDAAVHRASAPPRLEPLAPSVRPASAPSMTDAREAAAHPRRVPAPDLPPPPPPRFRPELGAPVSPERRRPAPVSPLPTPTGVAQPSRGRAGSLARWLLGALTVVALSTGALALWRATQTTSDPLETATPPTVTVPRVVGVAAAPAPESVWTLGPPEPLQTLAARWRWLDAATPRDEVRFAPSRDQLYVATLPATVDAAVARVVAEAFSGTSSRSDTITSGLLTPVLLRTNSSLHVRAAPQAEAAEVAALQPSTIVVGVLGELNGTTSAQTARGDWVYVVVQRSIAGWSSAAYLDRHSRCITSASAVRELFPTDRQSALLEATSLRPVTSVRVGERRTAAYAFHARDEQTRVSYLGVFSSDRRCVGERIASFVQPASISNFYFLDATRDAGPTLVVLQGPTPDGGTAGDETWQAFELGRTDLLWSTVVASGESVAWNARARVTFARNERFGVPGYWPIRVRTVETDTYLVWDGETLVPEP
jgi:serine/threonine protein kinase